uniref:Med12 domain-containing protein n=1 Tax=Caenorhabditis tropicalis TaxID=1561998 RepID=A0A1I7U0E9_9PELO
MVVLFRCIMSEEVDLPTAELPEEEPKLPGKIENTDNIFPVKGIPSWINDQPGDRMLRKTNLRMGTADVYKQNKNQEEDLLTTERLKKGYQLPVTQYELQSLVFNASENKLIRLERAKYRSQSMLASVLHKKGEYHMNYDRERKATKDNVPRFAVHNWKRVLTDRVKFFSALARGKPRQYLIQKLPSFRRKEFLFHEFYDYNIRYDRALWCVKVMSLLNFNNSSKTQKKTLLDVGTLELSQACNKTTVNLVKLLTKRYREYSKFDDILDMWYYKTGLMKYMFKDGCLDKMEFLHDLTDTFNVYFIKTGFKKTKVLEMFLQYYTYFLEDISSSILLSRRAAMLFSQGLCMISEGYDHQRNWTAYKERHEKDFGHFMEFNLRGHFDLEEVPENERPKNRDQIKNLWQNT